MSNNEDNVTPYDAMELPYIEITKDRYKELDSMLLGTNSYYRTLHVLRHIVNNIVTQQASVDWLVSELASISDILKNNVEAGEYTDKRTGVSPSEHWSYLLAAIQWDPICKELLDSARVVQDNRDIVAHGEDHGLVYSDDLCISMAGTGSVRLLRIKNRDIVEVYSGEKLVGIIGGAKGIKWKPGLDNRTKGRALDLLHNDTTLKNILKELEDDEADFD